MRFDRLNNIQLGKLRRALNERDYRTIARFMNMVTGNGTICCIKEPMYQKYLKSFQEYEARQGIKIQNDSEVSD